jgi:phospholipid-binding lipoprotein MlaA
MSKKRQTNHQNPEMEGIMLRRRTKDMSAGFLLLSVVCLPVTALAASGTDAPEETVKIGNAASVTSMYAAAQGDSDIYAFQETANIEGISDPLEPWNRLVFTFNDRFYFWVFKPVAQGYSSAVPEPLRIGVKNFFSNLLMPIRLVGALMQGKVQTAGEELGRFFVNSTVGMAGFLDIATKDGLADSEEDLGQGLASYGIGHGFYIVWPFMGPSSLRDSVGTAGEIFLNPVYYLSLISPTGTVIGVRAYEQTNNGSLRIGEYESFKKAAIDPYISLRDAYYQYRKSQLER